MGRALGSMGAGTMGAAGITGAATALGSAVFLGRGIVRDASARRVVFWDLGRGLFGQSARANWSALRAGLKAEGGTMDDGGACENGCSAA